PFWVSDALPGTSERSWTDPSAPRAGLRPDVHGVEQRLGAPGVGFLGQAARVPLVVGGSHVRQQARIADPLKLESRQGDLACKPRTAVHTVDPHLGEAEPRVAAVHFFGPGGVRDAPGNP